MESFLQVVINSGVQVFYLVGVFIGTGFILGYLEKYSNTFLVTAYGKNGILATAWIGTPIHELGHAVMCLVFRHRITKIKLLQLGDAEGVLGYVEHRYDRGSIYQRIGLFFIGIAPVFSGIFSIILAMYFLIPDTYQAFEDYLSNELVAGQINQESLSIVLGSCKVLWQSLMSVDNLLNPLFWLFLVLAVSISSHIALSPADIKESAGGLLTIYLAVLVINLISNEFGVDNHNTIQSMTTYNTYLLAFSSVALFFSTLTLVMSYILLQIRIRT